jgi:hypothetical protein
MGSYSDGLYDPSSAVDGHVRAWLAASWLVRGLPPA